MDSEWSTRSESSTKRKTSLHLDEDGMSDMRSKKRGRILGKYWTNLDLFNLLTISADNSQPTELEMLSSYHGPSPMGVEYEGMMLQSSAGRQKATIPTSHLSKDQVVYQLAVASWPSTSHLYSMYCIHSFKQCSDENNREKPRNEPSIPATDWPPSCSQITMKELLLQEVMRSSTPP